FIMPFRKISPDLKNCAMDLYNRGWEEPEICDILKVSHSSFFRWKANMAQHGNVVRPPSHLQGRSRIIGHAVMSGIHLLLKDEPDIYLDELVQWLAVEEDIVISRAALHHNLQEAGLT
ncbi:hypothetical protein K439DRAFT_1249820, partial [Ramaria rubella]